MKVSMTDLPGLLLDVLQAKLVPFVVGPPGVGKSAIAREIAEKNNLELIDIRLSQMDPVDLLGLPFKDGNKASYMPMDIFPLDSDPVPEGKKGWLVLLDEFNSAPMSVQAAAYKLILDHKVGTRNLNPKVALVAAGNRIQDKAIVNRIATAMQSRLIHFELEVDKTAWIKWADKANIDHRIKSFIHFRPELLHKFDPNHSEESFPCPRTWEFISKLLVRYQETIPANKIPLLAGTVGEGAAREFYSYSTIYTDLPTINDIISNPETISLSQEPSVHYALSGLISNNMTENNVDSLLKFLERLSIDFQVISLKSAITRNIKLKNTDPVKAWIRKNARELL